VLGAACYRPGDHRPRFAFRLHTLTDTGLILKPP
jgi:hypothetical protein